MFGQVWVIVSLTTLVMLSPGPDMVLVLRSTLVGVNAGPKSDTSAG